MPKEKVEKKDVEVLFPEAKVGDIVIKPWSFGMLFSISSVLEKIILKAEQKNIMSMFTAEKEVIPYIDVVKLFTIASNEVLEIITMTLGIDEDIVRSLDVEDGMKIARIIFEQNKEKIKNGLALLLVQPKESKKTVGRGE